MKLIIELEDVKALTKYLDRGVETVMISGTANEDVETWLKEKGYFSEQITDNILAITKNESYVNGLKEEEEDELIHLVGGSI